MENFKWSYCSENELLHFDDEQNFEINLFLTKQRELVKKIIMDVKFNDRFVKRMNRQQLLLEINGEQYELTTRLPGALNQFMNDDDLVLINTKTKQIFEVKKQIEKNEINTVYLVIGT